MVNLVVGLLESGDSSGGWGGGGGQGYLPFHNGQAEARIEHATDSSGNSLDYDLIEVDLMDPAAEMEQLCRRALDRLENGHEAALETEMLRQQLEVCRMQGTALRPDLLQSIMRILGAALLPDVR